MQEQERDLVEKALQNYQSCLSSFKKSETENNGFQDSVLSNVDNEIKKINDLIPKLKTDYQYDREEGRIMSAALDHYRQSILNVMVESTKQFPNLKFQEAEDLTLREIILTQVTIEDSMARRRR